MRCDRCVLCRAIILPCIIIMSIDIARATEDAVLTAQVETIYGRYSSSRVPTVYMVYI